MRPTSTSAIAWIRPPSARVGSSETRTGRCSSRCPPGTRSSTSTSSAWTATATTPCRYGRNDPADDLTFSPIFTDDSDTLLFSQAANFVGAGAVNTSPLARAVPATDGSDFRGTPDYFVDVAFPISVLIANGVVGSADELDQALFFPATAIAPSHHNKDYLNCPFLPAIALTVGASVAPAPVPAHAATQVSYTFTIENGGAVAARGVVVTPPRPPPLPPRARGPPP